MTKVLDRLSIYVGIISTGGGGGSEELSILLTNVSDRFIVADGTLSIGLIFEMFSIMGGAGLSVSFSNVPDRCIDFRCAGLVIEILSIDGGVGLSIFFSNVSDR